MNPGATTAGQEVLEYRDRRAPVEPVARAAAPHGKASHLIPLSQPGAGEQYAFTVDLDRCSGCKACVSACHSLNGLDDEETWRDVGLLIGLMETPDEPARPLLQTVTTACHHCLDPACANGCPVLAYEKDPVTGIVRHLDDQCIGCQYCVLKCPYDVPKFSSRRGIVRKCDMCQHRLAAGEAPACVQSCPHEAIRIDVVNAAELKAARAGGDEAMVPGAFPSDYTLPSTRYLSAGPLPASLQPANADSVRVEHAHAPLVWMLVLTQAGAGWHVLNALLTFRLGEGTGQGLGWAGWGMVVTGLLVGFAHLGRPLKAWRAFLGWRRSWMSREIILFGLYAQLATALLLRPGSRWLAGFTALVGVLAVIASAMIYIDTRRPAWAPSIVFPRFAGTMLTAGLGGGLVWSAVHAPRSATTWACGTLAALALVTWVEWHPLHRASRQEGDPLRGVIGRWRGPLRWLGWTRIGWLAVSGWMLVAASLVPGWMGPYGLAAVWAALIGGCIMERYGFFMACPSPRMPGGVEA